MQRYDHYIREFGETGYKYTSDMQRIENGEWVRHEDAAKLLADRDAEIERLRGRLALFEELCGYMRGPIEVARKSLPLRVAGEPRNVDIYWHTSEDSLDLFDAAVALVAEGRRLDG